MPDQHVQMHGCIRTIALRSRGPKDLAIIRSAGGMKGVQDQMLVLAQGEHQRSARLLQRDGQAASGEALPQPRGPLLDSFGRVRNLALLDVAGTLGLESPRMLFFISPVDPGAGSKVRLRGNC